MRITLNGELREVDEAATVAGLIAELELRPEFVAVERNGELVRRAEHAACRLAEGDSVEVVTLVGGG